MPAVLSALVILLLIGTEAGLLHAHMSPCNGRCQRKCGHALETQCAPVTPSQNNLTPRPQSFPAMNPAPIEPQPFMLD